MKLNIWLLLEAEVEEVPINTTALVVVAVIAVQFAGNRQAVALLQSSPYWLP
jgi:hypothetical protein